MEYITFRTDNDFKIAILAFDLDHDGMERNYVHKLIELSENPDIAKELIAYKLPSRVAGRKRKALSAAEQREALTELFGIFKDIGVEQVMIAQNDYFKTATGNTKAAAEIGTIFRPDPKHFKEYEDLQLFYVPNYKLAFYKPEETADGIRIATQALINERNGSYVRPGAEIIKFAYYPVFDNEVKDTLNALVDMQVDLTIDVETYSLTPNKAGIGTISFAWNENEGVAFTVDHGPNLPNYARRLALLNFFHEFNDRRNIDGSACKLIYHQASYDISCLIAALIEILNDGRVWNVNPNSVFDLLTDLESIECTKIISYLATNTCAGNKLSLKDQAVEFAGNYAIEEIEDITRMPVPRLLEYNLVDTLSTWYAYNKNYPKMVADSQEKIYREIFLPSLVDVVDMQLTGLPVDMDQVKISKKEIQDLYDGAMRTIQNHPIVKAYTHYLKEKEVEKLHAKWVKKRITVDQIDLTFNPNSDIQLAGLLFSQDFMNLPVLGRTATGAPSTKGKYLKDLKNNPSIPQDVIDVLDALIEMKDAAILLSTFIPALENAWKAPDGNYYMCGNFNLGGTVSGRLSSSDPNLQNIPAKSRLAYWIKICIKAPDGWLFMGLDFDSLEDKISALVTKDPNKLKVYTDGYDGHCLRAYSYFGDQMPDIDPQSVDSINSIAVHYKDLRQASKAPTFLLTYGGTYHGLMGNCGFSEEVALQIESNYHKLYKVSDDYTESQINFGIANGYIEVAFGLRVRTPILAQIVMTERNTPYAAKAEARTAGNAIGQSWGLLNNRACSEFMQKVRRSKYRNDIKVCCQIHDAQYYLVRADVAVVKWFNDNLVKAVQWQNHDKIRHPDVKLSGQTAIFYPTWNEENNIPTDASEKDISDIGKELMLKYAA